MGNRVFVTGYGIVSSLGLGVGNNLKALLSQKTGVAAPRFLDTIHKDMMLGEVKATNQDLAEKAGIRYEQTISRTILLGVIAAREAIDMAGLSSTHCLNAGLVNGTSVGGMDISERMYRDLLSGAEVSFKDSFYGHDCGHSTQLMAEKLRIYGFSSTISTACSSAANAILHGSRLIRSGELDCVIAGGSDALSLFTLNGFNSLKILDNDWCKPFDVNRNGLNLGEGAAFLILESENAAQARGVEPLAEVLGYGNANDAFHQTASSPEGEGAFLAMQRALESTKNPDLKIDYVNAHGTGTENNDRTEAAALQRIFGDSQPPISSTKAYTGHTLAPAGSIEAVFSLMAIRESLRFPNLNLTTPIVGLRHPLQELEKADVKTVMSNSFGFGGNCTSLIFSGV